LTGFFESSEDREECGFADATRTHECDKISSLDIETKILKKIWAIWSVPIGEVLYLDHKKDEKDKA